MCGFVSAITHICTSETKSGQDRPAIWSPAQLSVTPFSTANIQTRPQADLSRFGGGFVIDVFLGKRASAFSQLDTHFIP
jgi:hypothetical protein